MDEINKAIKLAVDKLEKEIKQIYDELLPKQSLLKTLQAACPHIWKNIGHDSHYDHNECEICGKLDFYA